MNTDDPKFTAHLLGECDDLTAAERAEIEALLFGDPAAAAEAAEMRTLAARLRSELAAEAAAGLEESQRAAVLEAVCSAGQGAKVLPFPRHQTTLAAIAASLVAGVTVALVYHQLRDVPATSTDVPQEVMALAAPSGGNPLDIALPAPTSPPVQQVQLGNITLVKAGDDHVPISPGQIPGAPQMAAMPVSYNTANHDAIMANAGASSMPSNTFASTTTTFNQNGFTAFSSFTGTVNRMPAMQVTSTIQTTQSVSFNLSTGSTVTVGGGGANAAVAHPVNLLVNGDHPAKSMTHVTGEIVKTNETIGEVATGTGYGFLNVRESPVSTFSADAATGSYDTVRRFLDGHQRPPPDAVRIEELLNHFAWDYPPIQGDLPFSAIVEVAECPWMPEHRLVRIGLKVARDVNAQVEFNPTQVGAYRSIGEEGRPVATNDENRARGDAGHIGSGHTVTALYEVIPAGQELPPPSQTSSVRAGHPLLTLKLRYDIGDHGPGRLFVLPLSDPGTTWAKSSPDFRFAAAVAGYGMLLRDSTDRGQTTWQSVATWAREGLGADAGGQRAEFLSLIEKAKAVSP